MNTAEEFRAKADECENCHCDEGEPTEKIVWRVQWCKKKGR
jgi:hypothetical protein